MVRRDSPCPISLVFISTLGRAPALTASHKIGAGGANKRQNVFRPSAIHVTRGDTTASAGVEERGNRGGCGELGVDDEGGDEEGRPATLDIIKHQ